LAAQSVRRGLLVGLTAGAVVCGLVTPATADTRNPYDIDAAAIAETTEPAGALEATELTEALETAGLADVQLLQTATLTARRGSRVIRCRINVSDPSFRSRRTVRVVVTVRCNDRVGSIRIGAQLRSSRGVVDRESESARNTRGVSATLSGRCERGRSYQGLASVRVTFPRGYRPSQDSVTVRGDAGRCR